MVLWRNMFLSHTAWPCECTLYSVTLLIPQGINCQMLWLKVAIAWDFSTSFINSILPGLTPPEWWAYHQACCFQTLGNGRQLFIFTALPFYLPTKTFLLQRCHWDCTPEVGNLSFKHIGSLGGMGQGFEKETLGHKTAWCCTPVTLAWGSSRPA